MALPFWPLPRFGLPAWLGQAELGGGFMRSPSDDFPFDLDTMVISGRWLLDAVDTNN